MSERKYTTASGDGRDRTAGPPMGDMTWRGYAVYVFVTLLACIAVVFLPHLPG